MAPNNWHATTLGAETKWLSGGTPSKKIAKYWDGEIPWISAVAMGTTRLFNSPLKISQEGLDAGSKLAPQGSSLLLVRGSALHKTIPMGRAEIDVAFNQDVKAVLAQKDLLPDYLYFWLLAKRSVLLDMVDFTGIGAGKLDTKSLQSMPLFLPPKEEQEAIVYIARALDDKIDLNRRMNETLEAMARAIFKSWFIDFDGCTEFEDSELGPIPKGWRVAELVELAALETTTVKPFEQPDKLWEHFSIPSFDSSKAPTFDLGESIKSNKYVVPKNSILVSKLNPQFPRVWYPDPTNPDDAICSTEFMPFVPIRESDITFLYEMMCSAPIQDVIVSNATGSTGSRQRVKPKEIAKLKILIPPEDLIDSFNQQVVSFHAKQALNRRQSRTLAQLRDILLPKLISGELLIPEAEKIVGDA